MLTAHVPKVVLSYVAKDLESTITSITGTNKQDTIASVTRQLNNFAMVYHIDLVAYNIVAEAERLADKNNYAKDFARRATLLLMK